MAAVKVSQEGQDSTVEVSVVPVGGAEMLETADAGSGGPATDSPIQGAKLAQPQASVSVQAVRKTVVERKTRLKAFQRIPVSFQLPCRQYLQPLGRWWQ